MALSVLDQQNQALDEEAESNSATALARKVSFLSRSYKPTADNVVARETRPTRSLMPAAPAHQSAPVSRIIRHPFRVSIYSLTCLMTARCRVDGYHRRLRVHSVRAL
jgi:hypothetical protein